MISCQAASTMKEELIAPCGINCAVCLAHLRQNNPCPGCRVDTVPKPVTRTRCKIKTCDFFRHDKGKYCSECNQFPCHLVKHLDSRYREKYHLSLIDNLVQIRTGGIKKFLAKEKIKWHCDNCNGTVCLHTRTCINCGCGILGACLTPTT
jgi:hypothetical protein